MALTKIGNACAHLPGVGALKSQYPRIGTAFTDEQGRLVIKLDSLPLSNSTWQGWINVYADTGREAKLASPSSSEGPTEKPF